MGSAGEAFRGQRYFAHAETRAAAGTGIERSDPWKGEGARSIDALGGEEREPSCDSPVLYYATSYCTVVVFLVRAGLKKKGRRNYNWNIKC